MKQKSLRQLAREIGVSVSYLSQIMNGKRPASQKVLSTMLSIGSQGYSCDKSQLHAKMQMLLGNRLVVGQRTLNP